MSTYIDAHCHLEKAYYGDGVQDVIDRAFKAGLSHLIAVGASHGQKGMKEVLTLCDKVPQVYAAIGLHPHEAAEATADDLTFLEQSLVHPKVVALGEVGLDYFYTHSPKETQMEIFRKTLTIAKKHDVPIMLHVRDAHQDTLRLLKEIGLPPKGGVIHCFTGGEVEARDYLDMGFYLSIPGIVTFKNAESLRAAVRMIPLERLLIETDAPYLAPVPYRGKQNEPAFVVETAKAVGNIKNLSGVEIGAITSKNAKQVFGIH